MAKILATGGPDEPISSLAVTEDGAYVVLKYVLVRR